jgi:hypothetical protein
MFAYAADRKAGPVGAELRTARDGFEPPFRGPEPRVLPLDDRAETNETIATTPLSHPVGLTRPVEMPASADAEDQRNEGELPQA